MTFIWISLGIAFLVMASAYVVLIIDIVKGWRR